MGDVYNSCCEKKETNQYKRLQKKNKTEECEKLLSNSKNRYRSDPIPSRPNQKIQQKSSTTKTSISNLVSCPIGRLSEYSSTHGAIKNVSKASGQKSEVTKWFFTRNKRAVSSEKNSENRTSLSEIRRSTVKKKIEIFTKKHEVRGLDSVNTKPRRGPTSNKLDGQIHTPEDLSRSSSITNLNASDQSSTKVKGGGTKPRKSASRDKLDKIGSGVGTTERKNEKKGVTKNNNKFDPGDTALALDSLQEIESLRVQLHQMATEKTSLALELGEQKGHIHSLKQQIESLKMYQEQSNLQLEQLTEENTALRNRLRDVAHSPLSDNEKQQLLFESHRHHSSAPASIATNPLEDGTCGDVTACPTPDWDKHSSSNVSEVSVACLQDKINQMQETHYSTNEELQATLQELTDLQRQLTELQQENERLLEEKNLMFDSLCRQTERLKDTRQEVESLKTLLYREKNEPGMESAQEREEKLVDLLKSAQDEHESLISKHEQLSSELQETREANDALHDQLKVLTDRNGTLESTLDAKHAEHKLLDQELALAKDESSGRQIEINRLKDLLENARTKISELEQDRTLSDKSELDELLDNARKEKDTLESEVAHLKEQLARSKNEIDKLREQVSILQEECKVIRNNARSIQSDLEYKCEKLLSEKTVLTEQLHSFQDVINELQVQAQCQTEDKRNLSDVLAETQRNLSESERRIHSLENELADVKKLRKEENEEWEKFQNDLLTSVRVANDFKTEAQQDLQKMIMENKEHRNKVRQLEAQLDKLKGGPSNSIKMPEERRNSQPFPKQKQQRRTFGSLPNLLESLGSDKDISVKKSKRPKWMRHQKQLSQEEGKILDTLNEMYKEIDPSTPDNLLTSEQVVIKKLKTLYEDDSMSYRPVAPRKKDDLAISRPLLESVISNPKLERIANNPDLRSLDTDRFSWLGNKKFTDDLEEPSENRSTFYVNTEKEFSLKRYSSKEDLTRVSESDITLRHHRDSPLEKRSSLKSIHSESSSNFSQKKRVSFNEEKNSCLLIKDYLSFESLEDIYKSIDPDLPEEQLTKEQRFALRLKVSFDNLGKKPDLRKRSTIKKHKVTIGLPTKDSVMKNTKLCCIIKDPIVKNVGVNSEQETVELRNLSRMKRYLGGINIVSKNSIRNDFRLGRSLEDISRESYLKFKRISSSMENLPSDMRASEGPTIEVNVVTKVLPKQSFAASLELSSNSSSADNSIENLAEDGDSVPVVFVEHCDAVEMSHAQIAKTFESVVLIHDTPRRWESGEDIEMNESEVKLIDQDSNTQISFVTNVEPMEEIVESTSANLEENKKILCPSEDVCADNNQKKRASCLEILDFGETPNDVLYSNTDSNEGIVEDFENMDSMLPSEDRTRKMSNKEDVDGEPIVKRLLSINSIEMEHEDDILQRYKRFSIDSCATDRYSEEDCHDVIVEEIREDSKSFQSINLSSRAETPSIFSRSSSIRFFLEEIKGDDLTEEQVNGKKSNTDIHRTDSQLDRLSTSSCDDEEIKEKRRMRFLYKDVVQEIKRKYSYDQTNPGDSSDEDEVHIFSPSEGKIEVKKNSENEEVDENGNNTFFDDFFNVSRRQLQEENYCSQNMNKGNAVITRDDKQVTKDTKQKSQVTKEVLEEKATNTKLDKELQVKDFEKEDITSRNEVKIEEITEISEDSRNHISEAEIAYIRYIRERHQEDFEDIDKLGYAIDEDEENNLATRHKLVKQNAVFDSFEEHKEKSNLDTENNVLDSYNSLLEREEQRLKTELDLSSAINKRNSRPLSEINMDDINFIESMKLKYLTGDQLENVGSSQIDVLENPTILGNGSDRVTEVIPPFELTEVDKQFIDQMRTKYLTQGNSLEHLVLGSGENISERTLEFLLNERKNYLPDLERVVVAEKLSTHDMSSQMYNTPIVIGKEDREKNSFETEKNKKVSAADEVSNKGSAELEFISTTKLVLRKPSFKSQNSTGWVPCEYASDANLSSAPYLNHEAYEPVYANYQEIRKEALKNYQISSRKPKPLPRKLCSESFEESRKRDETEYIFTKTIQFENNSVLDNNIDTATVKIKTEKHEFLPNSSEVMDNAKDLDELMKSSKDIDKSCNSLINKPKKTASRTKAKSAKPDLGLMNAAVSSNVLVRKTKKFIKDGDQVEEFDEATGVLNVELENVSDNITFDTKSQLIPDDLIDYADSESKVMLFDAEKLKQMSDFVEPCSRPQTSGQGTTPFRLSYYGENSEESVDINLDPPSTQSREKVAEIKQKFESLAVQNDECKRNSVILREFNETQRTNLAKLLSEKAAYDLVFKTDSKYWFDNSSELEKSDAVLQASAPSFESTSSGKPLNITILDPVESKTNANYQHLFEKDTVTALEKPFIGNIQLSELNLKTSIPCVDFTTLNSTTVERGSNASLYNFGIGNEDSSVTGTAVGSRLSKRDDVM